MAAFTDDTLTYDVVFTDAGPLGLDLESGTDGTGCYVTASKNDRVAVGHQLVGVNGASVTSLSFDGVLGAVKAAPTPRTLLFAVPVAKGNSDESAAESLPLPDDFFDGLEGYTADEEAEILAALQDGLKRALKLANESPEESGLSLAKESQGVTVHQGKLPGSESDAHVIRARTQVPLSAAIFMDAALCPRHQDFRKLFSLVDPSFQDGQVIKILPSGWTTYKSGWEPEYIDDKPQLPFCCMHWGAFALPFPLWRRDFVWFEITAWAPDGSGVSIGMTLPKFSSRVKSLEDSHSLVRGEMGLSGYVWKDAAGSDPELAEGDGHMMVDLTFLLQVDPKGILPAWAVNLVAAQQGFNVLRVRKYAEEQRKYLSFMQQTCEELNRTEVLSATISAGDATSVPVALKKGQTLVWQFVLEAQDIDFSAGDDDPVPKQRHDANFTTQSAQGEFVAGATAEYTLNFDNKYSWWNAKPDGTLSLQGSLPAAPMNSEKRS